MRPRRLPPLVIAIVLAFAPFAGGHESVELVRVNTPSGHLYRELPIRGGGVVRALAPGELFEVEREGHSGGTWLFVRNVARPAERGWLSAREVTHAGYVRVETSDESVRTPITPYREKYGADLDFVEKLVSIAGMLAAALVATVAFLRARRVASAVKRTLTPLARIVTLKPYGNRLLDKAVEIWMVVTRFTILSIALCDALGWALVGYLMTTGPAAYVTAAIIGIVVFVLVSTIDASLVMADTLPPARPRFTFAIVVRASLVVCTFVITTQLLTAVIFTREIDATVDRMQRAELSAVDVRARAVAEVSNSEVFRATRRNVKSLVAMLLLSLATLKLFAPRSVQIYYSENLQVLAHRFGLSQ